MENIILEIVMPVEEITAESVVDCVRKLGVKSSGGFAVCDPAEYGKGAKYVGNRIELGVVSFTLTVEGDDPGEQRLVLNPIEWTDDMVFDEDRPIEVTRGRNGDRILFRERKDAVEWLRRKSVAEQLRYSVRTPDFSGAAIVYMEEED